MIAQTSNSEANSPAEIGRLVVYEKDATAELHNGVEQYAAKVRLNESRKLTKSSAMAELLHHALKAAGIEVKS